METTAKHGKSEIWKVNGISFASCERALNYCIENHYAITDQSEFETRNIIAHLWNVRSISEPDEISNYREYKYGL